MVKPGYKKTEIGVIPEDWDVFTFGDHFNVYAGGDVPKHSLSDTQSEKHPYPIFANAIQRKGLYGYTGEKRSDGDAVTITARGFLGHAVYRSSPFFPIVRLLVMEPIRGLDAKFATYSINDCVEFAIESTGVPQLTAPQVRRYSLAAPRDKEQQKAIAEALSDVDGLIAGLEALIAKKRDLKTATMQQLLTGKTRLPGFGEGVGMKQTELGEIPEDWDMLSLGSIGTPAIGLTYKPTDVVEDGILVLRSSNIQNEKLNYESNVFVRMDLPDHVIAKEGDLLICVRNGSRALIGKCALIDKHAEGSAFGAFMSLFKSKHSRFVYYQFKNQIVKKQIEDTMGATINQITNRDLNSFRIPFPPLDSERFEIAQVLSDFDEDLSFYEEKLTKTKALKQGMMQELLTGRTRLI